VSKTVKIQAQFQVIDADGTQAINRVTRDEVTIEEGTGVFPEKIAANTVDHPVQFSGVTNGKRVFLRSNQEVTLKINNLGDIGFPFGPGDGYLTSYTGITALYVTTGGSETEFEAVVTGD